MERVYVNGEHSSVLMKSMAKLWKDRKYCDAVLDINNENIELHKLILLAASPSVITKVNSITDRGTIVIKLEGKCYNKEAAKLCVQYLYKGIAKLTDTNVKAVTKIAEVLELKEILKICSSFRETFKLYQEETSESDVDYGSDTEEDEPAKFADQITDNLTEALEEALGDIEQMEKQTDKGDPGLVTVKMEMPMESCLVEAGKDRGAQKPEDELASAIESIQESENTKGPKGANTEESLEFHIIKQEPEEHMDSMGCDELKRNSNVNDATTENDMNSEDNAAVENSRTRENDMMGENDITRENNMASEDNAASINKVTQSHPSQGKMTKRDKKFKCDQCSASYTMKRRLKVHKKTIHEGVVKRYQCRYCERFFSTNCNKKRHEENIHCKIKKFNCEHCEAAFFEKVSLKGHLLGYHGIGVKPKCDKCGQEFSYFNNLKAHQKICYREGGMRLQCDQCPNTYSSAKTLSSHRLFVHSNHQKFVCELCGEKYSHPGSLIRHKKKHHKNEDEKLKIKIKQ